MPNSHNKCADPPEDDNVARLDVPAEVERSWSGVGLAGGPPTRRAQVWFVTGGQARAVAAGYNVGRPPYGYLADKIPHPVPARREQGKVKTRLVLDPIRAAVVRLIYDLYLGTGMGLMLIRDHLNADPAQYPPPTPPDPGRALGKWSTTSI